MGNITTEEAMDKLNKFQASVGKEYPVKVQFEGLVQLLRYIRDNKNFELKYYARIDYSHLSHLLRKVIINTDNQLMVFYDSIW